MLHHHASHPFTLSYFIAGDVDGMLRERNRDGAAAGDGGEDVM